MVLTFTFIFVSYSHFSNFYYFTYPMIPKCSLEMKIHGKVTVWPKCQIVIPKDVRTLIGINPGDDLMVISKGGIAIGMIKSDDVQKFLQYVNTELHENW